MMESTGDLLRLMFEDGETICVSHNKYGYHSVNQSDLDGDIILISPKEDYRKQVIHEEDINLIAINPISGFRTDKNVTAYRSFLIEMDDDRIQDQVKYVEEMEMPYSICVFSGNKSLHYGITLDEDLVNEQYWRTLNLWILNIMKKADQQTKNPSRSIRFPNTIRKNGKQLKQGLIEMRNRVSRDELYIWLNKFPDCKPKPVPTEDLYANREGISVVTEYDVPDWLYYKLKEGVVFERNATWFKYACAMAKIGFDVCQIVNYFDRFYIEESDFDRKEWTNTIESAYKKVNGEQRL